MLTTPETDFGPVPLVLGVVGHRQLPQANDALLRVIRDLLTGFRRTYPSTPIVLLSALAEGADRLVASEALDLGFSLVAALPLEPAEYEADFRTEESVADFRALLHRADSWFVVPPVAAGTAGDARAVAYANCGAYIAGKCVELIALWDGKDSPTGGTGQIVRFKTDGIPAPYLPEYEAFDPSRCGPVLHVLVPRGENTNETHAFPVELRYPRSAAVDSAAAFEATKSEVERFNREVTDGPRAGALKGHSVREQLATLADGYQRKTARSLLAVTIAVFLAFVAFNVYTTLPDHPLALLSAYLIFGAGAFVPYLLSRRGEWQRRYQDYRALEQMLQTAEYWQQAGIDRSVASRFAESERATIDWITVALRALTEPPERREEARAITQTQARTIYNEWIRGQYRYFTEFAGRRERTRERVSSRVIAACIVVSVVFTVGSHLGWSPRAAGNSIELLLFGAALFAVIAALIHNFAEKRGWREHSRHYELMAAVFGYAAERIEPMLAEPLDAATASRIRAILIALGDEAIRENVSWLNLHRSRPLNVPQV